MLARWREGLALTLEFAFAPAAASRFPRAQRLFLSGMLLLGGGLWLAFFATSVPERFFHAIDWGIEWQYYGVIQEAYQTRQIPYHVSEPIQPIQPTQRFLAIPETLHPLSPQAPLLAVWFWRARRRRGRAAPPAPAEPSRRALPVAALVAGLLVLTLVANEGWRWLLPEGLWDTCYCGTQLAPCALAGGVSNMGKNS